MTKETPRVGPDDHRYTWVEDWARLPDEPRLHSGFAHNALAVTRDGHVVGVHPADGLVVVLDADGVLVRSFDCGLVEGHGMCLVDEKGDELLWVADCGVKVVPKTGSTTGYRLDVPGPSGRVIKVRVSDGEVVAELPTPEHAFYDNRPYLPTAVAVDPDGFVWVGDGYGASLLHRFDPDGGFLLSLTGEESDAGRLNCPHGLLIDRRRTTAELYVADRENLRLLVFDLEGGFRREVAKGELARPSAMATYGDVLVVAELRARVALLDRHDRLVGHIGDNEAVADTAGWPNSLDGEKIVRQTSLSPGKFNSPHGLAIDSGGNLYVTEWLVGGRYIKLEAEQPT